MTVALGTDRKSTRLNSSHSQISYAVFCLKTKKVPHQKHDPPGATGPARGGISLEFGSVVFSYSSCPTLFDGLNYIIYSFFFLNGTGATGIYTLSLHDALPI